MSHCREYIHAHYAFSSSGACPSVPCALDSPGRPRVRAKQITSAVDEALAVEQDLRSECERLIERLTVRLPAPHCCRHVL